MKRTILFLLILVISFPLASAFSFGEFFSDFFTFTGMAVLDVKEEKINSPEKFEKISVPEPKKVEAEEEKEIAESGEIMEIANPEDEQEEGSKTTSESEVE